MDWEFFGIVATLTSATVVLSITWAVTNRILADTKRRFRRVEEPPPVERSDEVLSALAAVERRLASVEDRLDFTERLLEAPKGGAAQEGAAEGWSG